MKPGQLIKGAGCYTNGRGFVIFTTSRINGKALSQPIADTTAVVVKERSDNNKTGVMAVTYAPQLTCPPSCQFYPVLEGDIKGKELRLHLQVQYAGIEALKIDALPATEHLRAHVVGDASSTKAAYLIGSAMVRYERRSPNRSIAYTYTHGWQHPYNVPADAWQGARVLASCETEQQVDKAKALGYATEWTYEEHLSKKIHVRKGVAILPCPNNFNSKVKCKSCMKCADIELLKKNDWTIGLHKI